MRGWRVGTRGAMLPSLVRSSPEGAPRGVPPTGEVHSARDLGVRPSGRSLGPGPPRSSVRGAAGLASGWPWGHREPSDRVTDAPRPAGPMTGGSRCRGARVRPSHPCGRGAPAALPLVRPGVRGAAPPAPSRDPLRPTWRDAWSGGCSRAPALGARVRRVRGLRLPALPGVRRVHRWGVRGPGRAVAPCAGRRGLRGRGPRGRVHRGGPGPRPPAPSRGAPRARPRDGARGLHVGRGPIGRRVSGAAFLRRGAWPATCRPAHFDRIRLLGQRWRERRAAAADACYLASDGGRRPGPVTAEWAAAGRAYDDAFRACRVLDVLGLAAEVRWFHPLPPERLP